MINDSNNSYWGTTVQLNTTYQNRSLYTATAGQTTFSITYSVGFVDVWLNGIKLRPGVDFTASDGLTVVLAVGANLNDVVECHGYL